MRVIYLFTPYCINAYTMRHTLLASLCLVLAIAPAVAAETPWQEVAPGVKLRLISSGKVAPDGTTLLGLEINMPETTKTYWRVPGDTGLPTVLDFAGSSGVTSHEIVWPYPTRDQTESYLDYVYFGPTVLPIEVKLAGQHASAEVSAVLGVCSDICVPAQAKFSLELDDSADMPNGLRLRQSVADAPIAWSDEAQPLGELELRADERTLAVHVLDPTLDPDSIIAATADGEPLFGAPQKSPEPDLVLLPIQGKGDPAELVGRDVQLTFITDMGAYELTRTVPSPKGQ